MSEQNRHDMAEDRRQDPRATAASGKDNVMGVREGRGLDQYGGSVAGGQSGGGAYPNPHTGQGGGAAGGRAAGDSSASRDDSGGQSSQGYYGGGQAGSEHDGGSDHHAASTQSSEAGGGATYQDHASQQGGAARADFERAVHRSNLDKADERDNPGDTIQGSDGLANTGQP